MTRHYPDSLPSSMYDESLYVLGNMYAFFIAAFVTLDGKLDGERFRRSISGALDTHPILKSFFRPGRWRSRWEVQGDVNPDSIIEEVDLGEGANSEQSAHAHQMRLINRKIDASRELPLRFQVLRSKNQTRVGMVIHHALADGRGTLEILKALHHADNGTGPAGPVIQDRGVRQLLRNYDRRQRLDIARKVLRQLIEETTQSHATPVAMNVEGDEGDVTFDRLEAPPDELRRIHTFAKSLGATVNDALLAATFQAIHAYNLPRGRSAGTYGLGIAVDLRGPAGISGGIANLSGLLGIPVPAGRVSDPEIALEEVAAQTRRIKARYPGLMSLVPPTVMNAVLPASLLRPIFRKLFEAFLHKLGTPSALTNIGPAPDELERMWGLDVTDLYLLAPVVERPSVILAATTFKQRLSITMGYRSGGWTPGEASEFRRYLRNALLNYGSRV